MDLNPIRHQPAACPNATFISGSGPAQAGRTESFILAGDALLYVGIELPEPLSLTDATDRWRQRETLEAGSGQGFSWASRHSVNTECEQTNTPANTNLILAMVAKILHREPDVEKCDFDFDIQSLRALHLGGTP